MRPVGIPPVWSDSRDRALQFGDFEGIVLPPALTCGVHGCGSLAVGLCERFRMAPKHLGLAILQHGDNSPVMREWRRGGADGLSIPVGHCCGEEVFAGHTLRFSP